MLLKQYGMVGILVFVFILLILSTLILIRIQHRFALAIGDLPSHQKKKDLFSFLFCLKNVGSRYRFSLFLHFLCGVQEKIK